MTCQWYMLCTIRNLPCKTGGRIPLTLHCTVYQRTACCNTSRKWSSCLLRRTCMYLSTPHGCRSVAVLPPSPPSDLLLFGVCLHLSGQPEGHPGPASGIHRRNHGGQYLVPSGARATAAHYARQQHRRSQERRQGYRKSGAYMLPGRCSGCAAVSVHVVSLSIAGECCR